MADEPFYGGDQANLPADAEVYIVNRKTGERGLVPRDKVDVWASAGYEMESPEETQNVVLEREYGDSPGQAALEGAARGLTFGLSDLTLGQLDEEGFRERRARNEGAAIAGEVGGAVLGAGVGLGGAVTGIGKAAQAATAAKGGGGLLAAGARGATEGAFYGAGQGLSEAALSEDPLTAERVLSGMASGALFGGAVGGVAGVGGRLLADGATAGKAAAGRMVAKYGAGADDGAKAAIGGEASYVDDIATLDRQGLRDAAKAEVTRIKGTVRQEAATVMDDLKTFAKDTRAAFITVDDKAIGGRLGKTKRGIMRSLDDPKGWVEDGFQMRNTAKVLRVQEQALNEAIATGKLSERGLSQANEWLEKNLMVQERIKGITDALATPASPRLSALHDAIGGVAPTKGIGQRVAENVGAGLMASMGFAVGGPVGAAAGAVAGRHAADAVLSRMTGRLASGAKASSKAFSSGVEKFFGAVERNASKATRPVVSGVLASVSYAPEGTAKAYATRPQAPSKNPRVEVFRARARELDAMTTMSPEGKRVMRPEAREQLNARLAGVFAVAPQLADKMESAAARRLEFLAEKMPRRPGPVSMPTGPDRWQPSEFAMAEFARYADAVEHPENVIERMANGNMTPEDAEALKTVYPELYEDTRQAIFAKLPELREALPYQKRLMLSLFFDAPVDPAMEPHVVERLQSNYATEPGTEGGTQSPTASFGSLKSSQSAPTQAQKFAG